MMATIQMPEGEFLRRAIKWISEERQSPQSPSLLKLIEEAGKQYNLSPKECDFLIHFFIDSNKTTE
jgi:hypothetical protein